MKLNQVLNIHYLDSISHQTSKQCTCRILILSRLMVNIGNCIKNTESAWSLHTLLTHVWGFVHDILLLYQQYLVFIFFII